MFLFLAATRTVWQSNGQNSEEPAVSIIYDGYVNPRQSMTYSTIIQLLYKLHSFIANSSLAGVVQTHHNTVI